MCQQSLRSQIAALLLLLVTLITPSRAEDQATSASREEIRALPLPLPMFAYLVRPVGDGPFLMTLATSLPLGQFASVHKGAPAQTFEQDIDE